MPDTSVNFAPSPETLTTDERLAELAQILAATVDRANPPKINENSANDRDSSLDILAFVPSSSPIANPSWRGRMTKTRTKSVGKAAGLGSSQGHAVLADLVALKAMTVPELREKWAAIFDAPAPNTSRQNLELRLGYRIQELAFGGIGRDTRRTLDALAAEVASGEPGQMVSDPRRPMPGTKLVREWNGVEHTVTVLPKGL